jgi:hypothetical protein
MHWMGPEMKIFFFIFNHHLIGGCLSVLDEKIKSGVDILLFLNIW